MAWQSITNNPTWEYDNNPPDPGGAQHYLWTKQVNGIRTVTDGTSSIEIYTKCRKKTHIHVETMGELNKTFWDNV